MRLIFMGTPDFSVTVLKALIAAGHDISCVYAQPPRPAGRGMELKETPVHAYAKAQGIEVRTPKNLRAEEDQQAFADLKADAAVVVAYGLLLPKFILNATRFGCFNVHASQLPRWRGAAPIQRAIMEGDAETGVAIMRMEEGLDTGPVMRMLPVRITEHTTAASLHDELASVGAKLMVEVLENPSAPGVAQPTHGATYAKKIEKAEARIDFNKPAALVRNHIHGLSPFPGAWCMLDGARLKLLNVEVVAGNGESGTLLDDKLTFACAMGAIRVLKLQREGKGPMEADVFLRGFSVPVGTRAQ
ncbi:methionyl-tRNA formyltransferase [Aestuariivirga litoralis]|uniref:methionyl-tRNA formyltransferase n=1 Tax=Aestuariivirga litoralis TaxID=2650924 RepID=UPI0018C6018D|nr:methionyl-tRNA formyltransferase [Aestuariivirga litoralis]MBG1232766.1 methionyl-tRNA formyltransferase [Aestuariivirga litoralis]